MAGKIIRVEPGQEAPQAALKEAAEAAKHGTIIAFPTDTVYGLGTTALLRASSKKIYDLKGRDPRKPLPILVHSTDQARRWVEWSRAADALAAAFWPGPLTLVLPPTEEGRALTQRGLPTLGIRVPAHPVILGLLELSGVPWATTSANLSGQPAMSLGADVAAAFADKVGYVFDAGKSGGVESSVVAVAGDEVRVFREGALSQAQILRAVGA